MDTHETKIYLAILIAACVLAIVIIFFIITIVKHHRKNVQLYKEKIKAEISTLEKERKRVASDLHDDLGPLLSAVKLQISSVDAKSEEDTEVLEKATRHIDGILEKLREISNDLIPSVLMRKGLFAAMEDFINTINQSGKMQVSMTVSSHLQLLPHIEIHLYRIVHEILHNCIKHSGASRCNVLFNLRPLKLIIEVTDDGKGFDQDHVMLTSLGGGLRNILSRTEILQGEMFLETKPGKGTRYLIEIPGDTLYEVPFSN